MKNILSLALITILSVALTSTASAAPVVTNGSFEDGVDAGIFTTLLPGSTSIDGWEVVSGSVDYIGTYWDASDGDKSIDLSGTSEGVISQEFNTIEGALYRVTFDLSGNPAGGLAVKTLEADVGGTPILFEYDTSANGNTLIDMKYSEESFDFMAEDMTTILTFASTTAGFFGPALDNVSVEQVLPFGMDECKKGGWETFGMFKNQGDCVSYVQSNENAGKRLMPL